MFGDADLTEQPRKPSSEKAASCLLVYSEGENQVTCLESCTAGMDSEPGSQESICGLESFSILFISYAKCIANEYLQGHL